MPSTSAKQAKFMRAIAHGWKPDRMKSPPSQAVAKKFMEEDMEADKYARGGLSSAVMRAIQQAQARGGGRGMRQPRGRRDPRALMARGRGMPGRLMQMMQQRQGMRGAGAQKMMGRPPPMMMKPGVMPGRQFIGGAGQTGGGMQGSAGPAGGPQIPPNLRGYLQKMRMQNRPAPNAGRGVNRVGQSDQQGAQARALQRGTGRPPMSRRQGFYR